MNKSGKLSKKSQLLAQKDENCVIFVKTSQKFVGFLRITALFKWQTARFFPRKRLFFDENCLFLCKLTILGARNCEKFG
jgi:hypothetical protein